ncbi:cytochrome P450 [Suillus subaureus]|uniref:Cytochrome P450 n=1 Tax=Suillus subaureus TaxID=48587 RepID=A0A9P7ELE2_9AGAM|nr:cytochrome P450 [Suillus subaureus]KAG1824521.1 cytochrome P450 [Suillus subaureus]
MTSAMIVNFFHTAMWHTVTNHWTPEVSHVSSRSIRTASSHRKNLPPGPTPIPFLGNVFDIKADAPWVSYATMQKTYGDTIYTRALNMKIIVLNSEEVADELLEKRSRVYSDRPYIVTSDLFGWEWATPIARYGERFRIHRRLYHQVFRSEAALTYCRRQLQKAYEMLTLILHDPAHYGGHFEVFVASVVLSVTYDYDIASHDDVVLNAAKRAKKAALFGAFPLLKKLPSWIPGLGLKDANLSRQYVKDMLDFPYNHANGSAQASMVSDALERYHISEDTDNPEMVTEIKASAATAYAGGCSQYPVTTAASLLTFTLAMMNNPKVQERAQAEIDKVVGLDRLPNFDDLPALPYNPFTPLAVPHSNTEDDFYRGYFIPKGAQLSAAKPLFGTLNDDTVPCVFGFGRRRHPGRHVGDASLWSAIACILGHFHDQETYRAKTNS